MVVARIGRICEKCRSGGLGEWMGKCDGVRVYGAALAPPPPPSSPESDKRKGTRKIDKAAWKGEFKLPWRKADLLISMIK